MPEIISLLSSPLKSPLAKSNARVSPKKATSRKDAIFDLNSDDYRSSGFSDELDFPITQPAKRRKVTPKGVGIGPGSTSRAQEKPIHLLSDDNDLPTLSSLVKSKKLAASLVYDLDGIDSDPIVFTSSAPDVRTGKKRVSKTNVLDFSDDLPDDIFGGSGSFSLSQPTASISGRQYLSERTANSLANIGVESSNNGAKPNSSKNKGVGESAALAKSSKTKVASNAVFSEDLEISSAPLLQSTRPAKISKLTETEKKTRAVNRAAAKTSRDQEKEAEKECKRIAKELKDKEKQEAADRAEVNKSKIDKKYSTPEMIVDMSRGMEGKGVGNQVVEYMKQLGVETTFSDEEVDLLGGPQEEDTSTGNVVKWRRKVKARYNDDLGHWEPLETSRVDKERHILIHLTAVEFAGLAGRDTSNIQERRSISEDAMAKRLDSHISSLRRKHKDCNPIYLIEGLAAWLRKNKNAKNRAYAAAVRAQDPSEDNSAAPTSSQARKKKKASDSADLSFIDEDIAEGLLLHLQVRHQVLIHQTTCPAASAEWIKNFTEHVSTIPYRHERMLMNDGGAAFCMDVGQVKTGDDPLDTYVKMLQEVQRVTPSMAYGIANNHPNVQALVGAFKKEGPLLLEDVKKSANKDGAVTNSRLGPAVSKRLYKVFTGLNPLSTDGIA